MSDTLPTATRVSDPGIRALYRLENRWQAWLDVEVALARAQAELGIIPADAAEAIAKVARLELMDRARIDEGFARTGHTLVPLVWELSRVVGEPHGGWVHWGATTQNITQTGDLLVLRQAHRVFLRLIGEALSAMAELAERGADLPIPACTGGPCLPSDAKVPAPPPSMATNSRGAAWRSRSTWRSSSSIQTATL